MQHPFEGVIVPERRPILFERAEPQVVAPARAAALSSRRKFFVQCMGAAAGVVGLLWSRTTQGQQTADQPALRTPGGQDVPNAYRYEGSDTVTTQALGEEGGINNGGGQVTTYAVGEEGAGYPGRRYPYPPRDQYTTYALGEEGSWPAYPRYRLPRRDFYYRPPNYYPPRNRYTTQALGEEGGWWY